MSVLAVKIGMVFVLLAVGAGRLAPHANGSRRVEAAVLWRATLTLYSSAQVAKLSAVRPSHAHRETCACWLAEHPLRDAAAFAAWAQRAMGSPPGAARQRAELAAMLHRLATARSTAGVAAATWLEQHGKKQVWRKLYGHQYRDFAPSAPGKREKQAMKAALNLGAALQASAKDQASHGLRRT